MAVKILEVKKESCPATLFIGKRYDGNVNWGEWWANDWFSVLEKKPCIPFNGDAYIGANWWVQRLYLSDQILRKRL